MESTRVLIVEDEGIVARDLQRTLKNLGYSVDSWAATGEEGIELVGKDHPDLVLMDIHLGNGMTGIEAATQIRDRFETPVIFLTAYSDAPTLELAKKSQPYGYILKPFDENELRTNIEVTLYKSRMEKELRENRRFLSALISQFPGFVYRCRLDEEMTLTFISEGIKRISGFSPEELMDRSSGSWGKVRHPDDRGPVLTEIKKAVEAGREFEVEYRIPDRGGKIRWVLEKGRAVAVEGQRELEGYVTEITERKKTEEIQSRNQKLESLGRLAGGIAHAYNNYLMIVFSGLFLMKEQSQSGTEVYKKAEILEKESERARFLTQRLLTFAQGGIPVLGRVSLVPLIKETGRLVSKEKGMETRVSAPGEGCEINADEGQIGQVLHGLLENAAEAMPGGGNVGVEVENVDIPKDSETGLSPGAYVRVKIRDEGKGIPNEIRDRVFEPFFTTKEVHSGLGLSAVYSIIKNHKGRIGHERNSKGGTTFVVHLPAYSGEAGKDAVRSSGKLNGKRVLLMDDEPHIQMVLREILTHIGIEVETCSEGEAAVRIYKENKEAGRPFDCVILDLTVPQGVGGEVAVALIREFDPEARVIASSGYSKSPVMGNYQKFGFCGVLPKPYFTEDLDRVLTRVLAG